jgi:hypothetical protein
MFSRSILGLILDKASLGGIMLQLHMHIRGPTHVEPCPWQVYQCCYPGPLNCILLYALRAKDTKQNTLLG